MTKKKGQLKLLTSGLKHEVNSGGDIVEYIVVGKDVNDKMLEDDYANGAGMFKALVNGTEQDFASRVSVIRGRSKEEVFKACIYLAGKHNKMDGIDPECYVTEYDYDDPDTNDAENVLPVMPTFKVFNRNQFDPFSNDVGWYSTEGKKGCNKNEPSWNEHENGPVLLWGAENAFNEPPLTDVVARFSRNRRVYLAIVEPPYSNWDIFSPEEDQGRDEESKPVNQDLLKCILDHEAALYNLASPKDYEEEYYGLVLQGLLAKYGMKMADADCGRQFVKLLLEVAIDMRAELMEKIVKRESKRNKGKLFTNHALSLLGKMDRATAELKGWDMINSLAGMQSVKEKLKSFVDVRKYNKLRSKMGIKSNTATAALLFVGPPGTAKTTVAQALAEIMFDEGLLPSKRFTSVTGTGLQGQYLGSTSYRVREIFRDNDVIFIDEAYSLTEHSGKNMYADEALAELCVCLEDAQRRQNKVVIFAGYGGSTSKGDANRMQQFLNANPGIKSRVSDTIEFPGLDEKEAVDVFYAIASQNGYVLSEDEKAGISGELEVFFKSRLKDKSFGNGRECRNLMAEAVKMAASRLMRDSEKLEESQMRSLTVSDIKKAIDSMQDMELARNGQQGKKVGFT